MEENKSKSNEYKENECEVGHSEEEFEALTVDLEDEEGNIIHCEIIDGFEFNDDEYAVVQNPQDETLYLFKVIGDDEVGELVLPDDDEFERAREYYESLIESEE
ncbi:hypothetical protein CLTEP_12450 [Clostridium tepidiprofundi DSM 19306]|uniref:DUF1292 domain-containing protein n=1 Tax=Clostridium tepidiprofundi DSM 19306 TaxID=1121338 RepID=A0A151B4Q7_9CLOT|nr:DUF1292 domain-containing protein [Clostridium tepidiprofundi]KYH34780.1 hypothetical protein CLTEP_12450 [Clostridium tepidiprofundi DSM 19306]